MDLNLDNPSYELLGNCEINLPDYIKFFECKEAISKDKIGQIIACGIKPGTKDLIILTKNANLMELNIDVFFQSNKNIKDSYPIKHGFMLEFVEDEMVIIVDSQDILDVSKELQLTNLEIDMKHENQIV